MPTLTNDFMVDFELYDSGLCLCCYRLAEIQMAVGSTVSKGYNLQVSPVSMIYLAYSS
jgi:hypothetical protein